MKMTIALRENQIPPAAYLLQLLVAEQHAGFPDSFSLLFLRRCGFYLGFEFTCQFHNEYLL
jgi:hypothetical protein